ncbi:Ammonium transporter [Mycena venus]|uniref:Ammonium transporter n=1 Tax=Mycena venus TaxID=2733690 RepID=A0A8H7CW24_9AGAR|nr:Ammonium transporter [Mycena venus]
MSTGPTYLHQLAARALNITYDASGDINWVDPSNGKLFVYNAGDTAWVLASMALVWIMIPGVGFFYSGLLRRKNALSMIYLSMMTVAVVSFQWFFWGFSLAFSETGSAYIGDLKRTLDAALSCLAFRGRGEGRVSCVGASASGLVEGRGGECVPCERLGAELKPRPVGSRGAAGADSEERSAERGARSAERSGKRKAEDRACDAGRYLSFAVSCGVGPPLAVAHEGRGVSSATVEARSRVLRVIYSFSLLQLSFTLLYPSHTPSPVLFPSSPIHPFLTLPPYPSPHAHAHSVRSQYFALRGVLEHPSIGSTRIPSIVFCIYQLMFAAITGVGRGWRVREGGSREMGGGWRRRVSVASPSASVFERGGGARAFGGDGRAREDVRFPCSADVHERWTRLGSSVARRWRAGLPQPSTPHGEYRGRTCLYAGAGEEYALAQHRRARAKLSVWPLRIEARPPMCLRFPSLLIPVNPILAIGAVAERGRLWPLIIFVFAWSTLVYDPIACWTWNSNGWSFVLGGLDFAGGSPVHISSGSAALAISVYLGKRTGWGSARLAYKPHNTSYVILGTVFLWFGWFGFNGGSALSANLRAANACIITNLAASVGGLVWMFWVRVVSCPVFVTFPSPSLFAPSFPLLYLPLPLYALHRSSSLAPCLPPRTPIVLADPLLTLHTQDWRLERKWSAVGFCSGAVAGLVAITPASGFVGAPASVLFGFMAGTCCNFATQLKFVFGYDDTLDIFASHAIGGIVGNLLTGLFAESRVAFYDGATVIPGGWLDHHYIQLAYQLADSVAALSYSFVMTTIILWIMHFLPTLRLRASEEAEILGIDDAEMGEYAYDYVGLEQEIGHTLEINGGMEAQAGGREGDHTHHHHHHHTEKTVDGDSA